MTAPEEPERFEAIVVCGTCDLVFRAHAGRGTCPTCGGEPSMVLHDLVPDPAPATAEPEVEDLPEAPQSEVAPTPPVPAADELAGGPSAPSRADEPASSPVAPEAA